MKYGRPEALASHSHSGCVLKEVSNFVEKMMSYVILGNDRICRFFDKKRPKIFYDAKLIFWSFATFFGLTIFWSGAKQRFCFCEIYYFINHAEWDTLLVHSSISWQVETSLVNTQYPLINYPVSDDFSSFWICCAIKGKQVKLDLRKVSAFEYGKYLW